MVPVNAPCSHEFTAVHNSGLRSAAAIKWVVLHDEEASTARSAAAWFANPRSEGSAHLCVDDKECYRTLSDLLIPWAASNANLNGVHIEMAGFASWTKIMWRVKHLRTLQRAAYKTARYCAKYHIPVVWLTASGLAAGHKGITTHREVSRYSALHGLPGDHSHTDPGPFFPRFFFMKLVKHYRKGM